MNDNLRGIFDLESTWGSLVRNHAGDKFPFIDSLRDAIYRVVRAFQGIWRAGLFTMRWRSQQHRSSLSPFSYFLVAPMKLYRILSFSLVPFSCLTSPLYPSQVFPFTSTPLFCSTFLSLVTLLCSLITHTGPKSVFLI